MILLVLQCEAGVDFQVSKKIDAEQRELEESNILRHEKFFSDFYAGVSEQDWVRFLRVNFYVNNHSAWQTKELRNRAEQISQKALEYLRNDSGYGEALKAEIIKIEENRLKDRTSTYFDEMSHLFSCIRHVSTLEAVQLLTSFLEYDQNTFVDGRLVRTLSEKNISLAGWAASSLASLGIDSAPEKKVLGYPDLDVPQWKEWWAEVVAGERVFGFEGDNAVYNHVGKVMPDGSVILVKSNLNVPSKISGSKADSKNTKPSAWFYWVLGGLIFFGVINQILNSRKKSSAL